MQVRQGTKPSEYLLLLGHWQVLPRARDVQRSSSVQEGVLLYNVRRQIFTGHKHPVMCDNEGLCATYWEAKARGAKGPEQVQVQLTQLSEP